MNYQIKLVSKKANIESAKIVVTKEQLDIIKEHSVKNSEKLYDTIKIRNIDQKMTYNDLIEWSTFKSKIRL